MSKSSRIPDPCQSALSIASEPQFIKKNYVVPQSRSWDYLKYRILRPLLKLYNRLLTLGYGKNKPWLSPACIKILLTILRKDMRGLEFGSGRSTYFFSNLLGELVSFEHHPDWYELVKNQLMNSNRSNVDYRLIGVEKLESKQEIETRYKSTFDEELELYRTYFESVNNLPDNYFDFVLIDGRARVECTKRVIPKLKSGGVLILDNSERERYKPVHGMLKNWNKVITTTGLTDTTLWFKPQD